MSTETVIEPNSEFDAWSDIDVDSDFDSVSEEPSEVQNDSEKPDYSDKEDETTDSTEVRADSNEDDTETPESEEQTTEDEQAPAEVEVEIPEPLLKAGLDIQDGVVGKYVKIDGEMKFVDLQDLGNDFSGQQALQRRFTEYDRQTKAWKAEVDAVNEYINNFQQKMQDPKSGPVEALSYLGELSGMPAYKIKEELIKALAPEIERRASLSEPELKAERLEAENKYLQEKSENEFKIRQQEQARLELDKKHAETRERYGISSEEWDSTVQYLKDHPNVTEEQRNDPEFVAGVYQYEKADQIASKVIPQVDANLLTDDDAYNYIMDDIVNNPDYTEEDVKEIIQDALEMVKKEQVTTKLVKKIAPQAKEQKQQQQKNSKATPLEIDDWDDLE